MIHLLVSKVSREEGWSGRLVTQPLTIPPCQRLPQGIMSHHMSLNNVVKSRFYLFWSWGGKTSTCCKYFGEIPSCGTRHSHCHNENGSVRAPHNLENGCTVVTWVSTLGPPPSLSSESSVLGSEFSTLIGPSRLHSHWLIEIMVLP